MLPSLRVCLKTKCLKCENRTLMSARMWPKLAAEKLSPFMARMAMSESPSRMIWSKPSSCAKERAPLAANTSTISTEVGNGITCVNAVITRPWSLRMMAPRPASSFSWKMAPSKLIFTQSEGGGSHLVWIRVGGVDDTGERILILWNTLLSTN